MNTCDNIVAPATGIGGAITIIRLSGPGVLECARRIWRGRSRLGPENARRMLLGKVGGDPALAVFMPGPASYTGDDVVELHCHGGAAAASAALRLATQAGCRNAEPGEFTFRAFMNGKLDLAQAEAVNDVITAGSDLALQLAERQLRGALSRRLETLDREIGELRAECESHLDFPDEELDWADDVPESIERAAEQIRSLLATRDIGATLRDGVELVIAGRPNAGKSSLLNLLLGRDRAIVSAIPGTTRDTVEAAAVLRGLPVKLTDTAGVRESGDPVEQLGIERSFRSIAAAGVTFWLLDASVDDPAAEVEEMLRHPAPCRIAVWNKIDLVPDRKLPEVPGGALRISVREEKGIEELLDAFVRQAIRSPHPEVPEVAVNARAAAELKKAAETLPEAAREFREGEFELAAIRLREAQNAIGAITGRTAEPDILDHIFSRFCIGK